jgi:hypothetical protein
VMQAHLDGRVYQKQEKAVTCRIGMCCYLVYSCVKYARIVVG